MKEVNITTFTEEAIKYINELTTQVAAIENASQILGETIKNNGVIHVFGSGHSMGFGIEMSGKPGTLVPINVMQTSDFVSRGLITFEDFKDLNNKFERRLGVADRLYNLHDINPYDAFIIISSSGINGLVIDLAQKAIEKKHPIIVITSMKHTLSEQSRHPSGRKLYEFGDVVIDNCAPYGDAMLETDGVEKICSISSITCGIIAHELTHRIINYLESNNSECPILRFGNDIETQKINQELKNKYKRRN